MPCVHRGQPLDCFKSEAQFLPFGTTEAASYASIMAVSVRQQTCPEWMHGCQICVNQGFPLLLTRLLILLLEAPSSPVYLGIGREGELPVNSLKNSPELIVFNG